MTKEQQLRALLLKVYKNFKRDGRPIGKYVVEDEYKNYRKDIEPEIIQLLKGHEDAAKKS